MGNLRFSFSNTGHVDPRVWQTAYITGIEGVPWHCRHQLQSDQFIIGRELDESGKVNIVWPTQSSGNLCLVTSSLRESEENYNLSVEIARGTLGRLKNQTAEWQRIGLRLPDEFFQPAEKALKDFLKCLSQNSDSMTQIQLAQSAIDQAINASIVLCQSFSQQALSSRVHSEGALTTLLGIQMPQQVEPTSFPVNLGQAFNLCNVRPDMGSVESSSNSDDFGRFDKQVEWCLQNDMKLGIGPLIDFRPQRLPSWMVLMGENYQNILDAACQHAEKTVERYRNKAQIWNCAAGLNSPNSMHWSDEEVLRMAVAVISVVRKADSRTPVVLTIEQPWSEYLRDNPNGISPLHFADALIRADLGLSGLALELAMDWWPGGSFPRDLIEISRLVDRWAMLGLPLLIYLSSPSSAADGTGQRVADWQAAPFIRQSTDDQANILQSTNQLAKPASCAGFVPPEAIVPLLVSKPAVHAVIWDQLTDQYPVAAESSGLLDSRGKPKVLFDSFVDFRRRFLM